MYLYTCQKCVAKPPPHPLSTARDSTTRKAAPLAANSEASDGAEAVEGTVITTPGDKGRQRVTCRLRKLTWTMFGSLVQIRQIRGQGHTLSFILMIERYLSYQRKSHQKSSTFIAEI
jgi:hypothetical protein